MSRATSLEYDGLGEHSIAVLAAFEAAERDMRPEDVAVDLPAMTYDLIKDWVIFVSPEKHALFLQTKKWQAKLIVWMNRAEQDQIVERRSARVGKAKEEGKPQAGRWRLQEFSLTKRGRWMARLPEHPEAS